ncbi:MAG: carboxypeptidase-like regulatory domain-containing protein [Bacteroidales bacterium]|nr:carboxypeptidase-like regulatory domain-containing protein [Bacteroidales bacterium]
MKKLAVCLTLLWLALTAAAQGVVEGTVSDSLNGEPLQYTAIGVVGSTRGTTTDVRGHYHLDLPAVDSVTLRYSFVGYRTVERRIAVHGNMRVDVKMSPTAQQLEGVEIVTEQVRTSHFTQIEVAKLDDAVGPTGGVESLVKMLPDVQSNNELSSQYSVRGGSFDENLVYINGIEVFRPMLIRSAQQEGMSIINPDMVSYILFSPGGFDATYGDKLSSVLDITYSRPEAFRGKASASLLGKSLSLMGKKGERLSYAIGARQHSNRYILGSLDTKGSYSTSYTDLQALVDYRVNDRLNLGVLGVMTRNVYGLVPESATTTFGGFYMPLELRVFFDGQEQDKYHTLLGAVMADYRIGEDCSLKGALSVQHISESESYDVQSQYFLYELAMGQTAGDTMMFDRGVGTFLEHARNRLTTDILSATLDMTRHVKLGSWQLGVKLQMEHVGDHLREWRWVDSAGYAMPAIILPIGDTSNGVTIPMLQNYANAENNIVTLRGGAYAQRDVNFTTARGSDIKLVAGLRGQLYKVDVAQSVKTMLGPRVSASYKPRTKQDILFRLAAGIYNQAPFYREYRRNDGSLVTDLDPMTSYQVMGTTDWRFRVGERPFTLTADLYYKYITHLIPYTIDNLRLRYLPDETAVAYATGLSVRLNGELVEGLESWASLSLMQTQEDIEGDGLGWLARPTDQRVSFKLFLQDNLPSIPWWRMSLSLVYGSGTPVSRYADGRPFRLPAYYRVDWGNTVQLSRFEKLRYSRLFSHVEDIQVGVEVFNLFNFRNVVSYLWVSDYDNNLYPVPNYLTARQLNLKVTVLF